MGVGGHFFLGLGVSGAGFDKEIIPHLQHILARAAIIELAGIATIDKRRHHPLIAALANRFKTSIFAFSAADLEAHKHRLVNPSALTYARLGCHGVAEAASLAAAGSKAQLVIPKTICHKVTFAVAA